MITFEQALSAWLQENLENEVGPLIKPESTTVELANYLELNRWQMQGIFAITVTFSSKLEASDAFTQVDELMKAVRWKPGVNWSQLINCNAAPSDNLGEWQYQGIYQITHRVKNSWQID